MTRKGTRWILAVVTAAVGFSSVRHSLAMVVDDRNPELAHSLAPWDGRITALLAMKQFTARQSSKPNSDAANLAKLALRQDPMAVPAVDVLGLQAQLRGNVAKARAFFAYSQKLTRRDFQAQLWAVEDAVAQSDIPEILRHYDIALRTSKLAPDVLFPILSGAIADPAIRSSLIKSFAGKPAWQPSFVTYVSETEGDLAIKASLFNEMLAANITVPTEVSSNLINRLVLAKQFNEGWKLYATVRHGARRVRSRDPLFTASLQKPSAFDWVPVDTDSISVSIQQNGRAGLVDFTAPPSVSGALIKQIQLLPSGDYVVEGHSIGVDQEARSLPYVTVSCYQGRELARVTVSKSGVANGVFRGKVSVPADCPIQEFTLSTPGTDQVTGLSGQIDKLALVPAV